MSNLKEVATQIRRDIVRMVHAVQSGHPGALWDVQSILQHCILK